MKRPWLLPLTPLWAAGAAWKNRSFDRNPTKAQRLQRPVISVGSLSAGGAGKTPFVIALGRALQRSGIAVDVLSRGYGRAGHAVERVNPAGTADQFGDEPSLIARAVNAPVYVASQRSDAGRMAEADTANHATVHLLDDGFQHRQLARDVDIVLLTQQDIHDTLLPAGDLREPLRSLLRADIVVLRAEEAEAIRPVLKGIFQAKQQPLVWEIDRHLAFVEDTPSARPFAFCGIARPESFRVALEAHGIAPAGFTALRDHQRYDVATIEQIVSAARRAGANGFLTTAKDAVKLSADLRARLEAIGPIAVADLDVRLAEEHRCIQTLYGMLPDGASA